MTDWQLISTVVVGTLLPNLIAVIQRQDWQDETRYIVAFLAYLAVTALLQFVTEGFDVEDFGWRDYAKMAALMIITGQTAFKLLWAKTTAPKIEAATS